MVIGSGGGTGAGGAASLGSGRGGSTDHAGSNLAPSGASGVFSGVDSHGGICGAVDAAAAALLGSACNGGLADAPLSMPELAPPACGTRFQRRASSNHPTTATRTKAPTMTATRSPVDTAALEESVGTDSGLWCFFMKVSASSAPGGSMGSSPNAEADDLASPEAKHPVGSLGRVSVRVERVVAARWTAAATAIACVVVPWVHCVCAVDR